MTDYSQQEEEPIDMRPNQYDELRSAGRAPNWPQLARQQTEPAQAAPIETGEAPTEAKSGNKPKRVRPEYSGLQVWSPQEVADRLGISRAQLYRMQDELPHRVRLSQARWGHTRASIERWIEERATLVG